MLIHSLFIIFKALDVTLLEIWNNSRCHYIRTWCNIRRCYETRSNSGYGEGFLNPLGLLNLAPCQIFFMHLLVSVTRICEKTSSSSSTTRHIFSSARIGTNPIVFLRKSTTTSIASSSPRGLWHIACIMYISAIQKY